MSLEKYKSKRKFDKTPEPAGEDERKAINKELIFVVQKHQATHLHYDFRLEKDGVLKSWAVPKGPSIDPEDKRLAIRVEDHPIEYAKFEGVIPEGNYGAGTVEIWDSGTYIPIVSDDNHWEFILKGKKLKGEFSLINIRNRQNYFSKTKGNENNFLLIKMKEPLGKLKKEGSMPHNIDPMLATLIERPFDKDGWLFEVKWDGYRAISEIEDGKVNLYSRNKLSYEDKFPEVVNELKKIKHSAVMDGEIVALDENNKPSFGRLQEQDKLHGDLVYFVFDILYLDGSDLQDRPLWERRKILKEMLPKSEIVVFSEGEEKRGVDFFEAVKKEGLEGIMAKNINSPYRQGARGDDWLKIKTHLRQEVVICGFTKPRGSREKFGSLVLGLKKGDELVFVGHVGTGFDDKTLESLYKKMMPLIRKKSPFSIEAATNEEITWIEPKLICEVSFAEWTKEGLMRQPVYMGLRDDKDVSEVTKESSVILSHLDKVFWPDEGITKGDLINYYKEISGFILPYLKDRPESLLRYPDGINGESFYHKNIEDHPDWVKTFQIKSDTENKKINYVLCQDEQTLMYMINLGCIDLNPWNSRISTLDKPDYGILDLDPEEAGFDLVIKTALTANSVLNELQIPNYVKTSGATGMHIYIPLGAKYSYEQVRQLLQLIAIKINERIPSITSLERSPSGRKGRVYLDVFQNARGQTLASVYSVRARPGATVSTPLAWSEVNEKITPKDFTIKNSLNRLEKHGDMFKPVLGEGIDIEKMLKRF